VRVYNPIRTNTTRTSIHSTRHTHQRTHARMHACTHAHMHACTHARAHTHTHTGWRKQKKIQREHQGRDQIPARGSTAICEDRPLTCAPLTVRIRSRSNQKTQKSASKRKDLGAQICSALPLCARSSLCTHLHHTRPRFPPPYARRHSSVGTQGVFQSAGHSAQHERGRGLSSMAASEFDRREDAAPQIDAVGSDREG